MSELGEKKLLILGGATMHCKLVDAAKGLGVYVIVTDYLEDSPAKDLADERWMVDICDVDEIVRRCRNEGIEGVLAVCIDPAQRPYQRICEKLGFPCFGNREQHLVLTDKRSFKDCCRANGVDVIPEYTWEDIQVGSVQYPILVKPSDGRGSRGQTVCYSAEEACAAVSRALHESQSGGTIIEKYMDTTQNFSMTYVIINGEACLVRTADRYCGDAADGLERQVVLSISPSSQSKMYISNVHDRVCKMLQRLKIQNAPVFMQGFIDGETVRFYDPGLRFPGAEYEQVFYKATGVDLMKAMVRFAFTGEFGMEPYSIENGYLLCGRKSVQILAAVRAGIITEIRGVDEIAAHPNVVTVNLRYKVGDCIPASGDVRQIFCEIAILAPNMEAAKALITWSYSKLVILDEHGENMVVSKIDPEYL